MTEHEYVWTVAVDDKHIICADPKDIEWLQALPMLGWVDSYREFGTNSRIYKGTRHCAYSEALQALARGELGQYRTMLGQP